jgi:hypothetical protein
MFVSQVGLSRRAVKTTSSDFSLQNSTWGQLRWAETTRPDLRWPSRLGSTYWGRLPGLFPNKEKFSEGRKYLNFGAIGMDSVLWGSDLEQERPWLTDWSGSRSSSSTICFLRRHIHQILCTSSSFSICIELGKQYCSNALGLPPLSCAWRSSIQFSAFVTVGFRWLGSVLVSWPQL